MDQNLLEVRGVTKTFPGVKALDNVDFTLRAGEIHALLGENGAGKSTLINIVTGALQRDAGDIRLAGQSIDARTPADAERLGIAAVHQEVPLLSNLSVAENLLFSREPTRFGLIDRGAMRRRAREMLTRIGLDIDVDANLGACSIAVQQMIAIARAIDLSAKVVVLDEPTASLDTAEVAVLFGIVRRLANEGVGIIFITHFLEQVYEISDRITVLRNGQRVAERPIREFPRHELISVMLGREFEQGSHRAAASLSTDQAPIASAKALKPNGLAPFNIDFYPGEIVGAAGLLGSGRTETALVLFGAAPAAGVLEIKGKAVTLKSPRDAIRAGFGFVSEDRKRDGLLSSLSIRENMIIALQARRGFARPLSRKQQDEIAGHFIKMLAVKTPDAEKPIGQLSGGNQQKVLLARWLATEPMLLLLDEPTRGVDIGAHEEILKLVDSLRASGMAVYLISSEIDELVAVAQRVSVMRDRRQVSMIEGDAISANAILSAIAEAPPA